MEKTLSNLKSYQRFFEDISDHAYSEEAAKPAETKTEEKPEKKEQPVKEEEEQSNNSLNKTLENCIENVEEIVRLFEKNDKKLIDLALPILDLCQTNLNFQEKNSEGKDSLYATSKKIIVTLVEKLKKEYANNDPVAELISNCEKLK